MIELIATKFPIASSKVILIIFFSIYLLKINNDLNQIKVRKLNKFNGQKFIVSTAMFFSMFGLGISALSIERLVSNQPLKSIRCAKANDSKFNLTEN